MNEKERKEFGLQIRDLRRAQGMSQQELADAARVGKRTIGNLEAGRVELQTGNLARVLNVLGYKRPARPWDDETDAFLQMVGFRLSNLDAAQRAELITQITLLAIGRTG